ncbi:AMIN-like domain-containing (lipo)protein, partial [Kineococcus glutinatus]|uniref:AMIN-like domain-containing (lipo)protein n=1 Tax=Kineococcus glutinatus TaxID=1070872 RepID=UPI0031EE8B5C
SRASAAPGCGQVWGSLPEADEIAVPTGVVTGVRAGRHACFDRLVVDVAGRLAGYSVRYVPQVRADGSGDPVPLRGGAFLEVVVHAPSYDDAGAATFTPPSPAEVVDVGGFGTFRQVGWGGSFEGWTTLGLGVRARLPFETVLIEGPGDRARLVVDVAHRW